MTRSHLLPKAALRSPRTRASANTGLIGQRRLRSAGAAFLILGALACSTEPSPATVAGVWSGMFSTGVDEPTLVVWLPDTVGNVSGYGSLRPWGPDFFMTGSFDGHRLVLDLGRDSATFTLGHDVLTGVLWWPDGPIPLTLARRRTPSPQVGRWVLTSVTGVTMPPGSIYTDTLLLTGDGRATITLRRFGSGCMALGEYTSTTDRVAIEFWSLRPDLHTAGGCVPRLDTLMVTGATMVRRRTLDTGTTEETYERR